MENDDKDRKWADRRFAGENVRDIARSAGVGRSTVVRATHPFGPYPQLVELDGNQVELEVIHARWVARRRAGESISSIARTDQASPATIKKFTAHFGPFPPPRRRTTWNTDQQWRWTQLRRTGHSTTRIATNENVSDSVVQNATRNSGPYPRPTSRHPDLLSLTDLTALTGIAAPSVYGWWRRHLLPDPVTTGNVGQLLWERHVLQDWCDTNLDTCPQCGAQALSLQRHISHRHQIES